MRQTKATDYFTQKAERVPLASSVKAMVIEKAGSAKEEGSTLAPTPASNAVQLVDSTRVRRKDVWDDLTKEEEG